MGWGKGYDVDADKEHAKLQAIAGPGMMAVKEEEEESNEG